MILMNDMYQWEVLLHLHLINLNTKLISSFLITAYFNNAPYYYNETISCCLNLHRLLSPWPQLARLLQQTQTPSQQILGQRTGSFPIRGAMTSAPTISHCVLPVTASSTLPRANRMTKRTAETEKVGEKVGWRISGSLFCSVKPTSLVPTQWVSTT